MILELDIGNSRIKWRLLGTKDHLLEVRGRVADPAELARAIPADLSLERLRIACVRPGEALDRVRQWALSAHGLVPEIAKVVPSCRGVRIFYGDPARLGVDRWLAMLAARSLSGGACTVIDCGTALTIDALDDTGQHLGGFIVPGLALSTRALTEHTGIRLLGARRVAALTPGHSTEDAVYNGALALLVALIERTVGGNIAAAAGEGYPVFLTGGDASLIGASLSLAGAAIRQVPDLVFDGLALALP